MGKPKKPRAVQTPVVSDKPKKTITASDLVQRAQALLDQFEFDAAERFCARAIEVEPTHIEALEMMASIKLELGDSDAAQQLLKRCVELSPDHGHSKYMSLAQHAEGHEALSLLEKGVAVLTAAVTNSEGVADEDRNSLLRQLSSAYCAMAEIFLTDCCFDDDAEERCERYLGEAQKWDASNPEALQCLASVRMSQQRPDDAAELMKRNLGFWLPENLEDDNDTPFNTEQMPPFEFRLNTVKLLIELAQYDRAQDVIETLFSDDDEVVQVWYLCGWAHHLMQQPENARDALQQAAKLFRKTNCDDDAMWEHIKNLLNELGAGTDQLDELNQEDGMET